MPRVHLFTAVAFLLLLALPSLASSSRVRALGNVPDLIEDPSGALRWYGAVVDYPDLGTLHLGDWAHRRNGAARGDLASRSGGVHVQLDEGGRWGTVAMHFGEDLPAPDPGGWFQAMWGRRMGDVSLALAFRATSWSDAASSPAAPLEGDSRFIHLLGLGARWDVSDATYLDLAVDAMESEVDYYRRNGEHPVVEEDLGEWDSVGVRGRVFHQLTDQLVWVGRLSWFRDLRPITDDVMTDLVNLDARYFRGGFGFHLMADPDNLVIISGDYRSVDDHRQARHPFQATWKDGDNQWWRIDARVGVESRVLPWLTLRASASYRRHVDEQQYEYRWADDFAETAYSYRVRVDTPVTVGLGLHLGSFDCDVVVNATAPFEIGDGLDGFQDGEHTNLTGITLRHAW